MLVTVYLIWRFPFQPHYNFVSTRLLIIDEGGGRNRQVPQVERRNQISFEYFDRVPLFLTVKCISCSQQRCGRNWMFSLNLVQLNTEKSESGN